MILLYGSGIGLYLRKLLASGLATSVTGLRLLSGSRIPIVTERLKLIGYVFVATSGAGVSGVAAIHAGGSDNLGNVAVTGSGKFALLGE